MIALRTKASLADVATNCNHQKQADLYASDLKACIDIVSGRKGHVPRATIRHELHCIVHVLGTATTL